VGWAYFIQKVVAGVFHQAPVREHPPYFHFLFINFLSLFRLDSSLSRLDSDPMAIFSWTLCLFVHVYKAMPVVKLLSLSSEDLPQVCRLPPHSIYLTEDLPQTTPSPRPVLVGLALQHSSNRDFSVEHG